MSARFSKTLPGKGPNGKKTVYRGVRIRNSGDDDQSDDTPAKYEKDDVCSQLPVVPLVDRDTARSQD